MRQYILLLAALVNFTLLYVPVWSLSCPDSVQEVTIFFINGIGIIETDTEDSTEVLKEKFENFIANTPINGCINSFKYAYNTNQNGFLDFYESILQVVDQDFVSAWQVAAGILKIPGTVLGDFILNINLSDFVIQDDLEGHLAQYDTELKKGNNIIIVGHSQGNLYSNEAFEFFEFEKNKQDKIKVVAVATPANNVAGDFFNTPHTTLEEDIIRRVPDALEPNESNPGCGSEWSCHFFIESYLEGNDSRERILKDIRRMMLPTDTGIIYGTVRLLSTGAAVEGASVILRDSGSDAVVQETETDGNGSYIFDAVPSGLYTVEASKEDFSFSVLAGIVGGSILQRDIEITGSSEPEPSIKFVIGDRVQINTGDGSNLNVRSTPNGSIVGQQPDGAQGTVIGGPVFAGGLWWWEVDFDTGEDGWSAEDFLEVVSTPSPDSLKPFRSVTIVGDYVTSGVGLRDTTQGSITISGIPSGATVAEAFLYWGMLDNGESPSLKNLNLNGTPITGTLTGSGPDTCWDRTNSFAYRADVTSLVPGSGTYDITGVASGGAILVQGASLVVLYENPGDPFRDVILLDGNVVFPQVQTATTTIRGFAAADPISAKTTFVVGDGQTFTETASFTGSAGTMTMTNPFDGSDGPLWDTDSVDVTPEVGTGDTRGSVTISIDGDCLMWVAQVFSVTSAPP